MARTKTLADADADDMRSVKAQAVARVIARRRPPRYGELPDGHGGTVRWMLDSGGEFTPPGDIGQWVDDRLARCPVGTPIADTLVGIFQALRNGTDGIPEAVRLAARLSPAAQFGIWTVLDGMPDAPGRNQGLKNGLAKAWKRQGLETKPGAPVQFEAMELNTPSPQARRVTYRTPLGNPASPSYSAA